MQLKSIIRYPVDIRRARRLLEAKRAPDHFFDHRPVALDLVTPQLTIDCGRHLASIAHYAQVAGSQTWLRCGPMLLARIARKIHGREMLAEPYVRWISPQQSLPADALVLRDYPSDQPGLRMLIGCDVVPGAESMPYPMHPATLPMADRNTLQSLRQGIERHGILFAGNQKPKYGDAKMMRDFGVLPRLKILETLRQQFPERVSDSLALLQHRSSIVLSDSRREAIPPTHWLPALARAQFFICCPGASQPTCHNLVEAMSVGTIPLIEYADRVTPALKDGVNAITFSGERGLIEAIARIDALSASEIEQLRGNVARFFDEHLCGERFLTSLRDRTPSTASSLLNLPFHDRNLFDLESIQPLSAAA